MQTNEDRKYLNVSKDHHYQSKLILDNLQLYIYICIYKGVVIISYSNSEAVKMTGLQLGRVLGCSPQTTHFTTWIKPFW